MVTSSSVSSSAKRLLPAILSVEKAFLAHLMRRSLTIFGHSRAGLQAPFSQSKCCKSNNRSAVYNKSIFIFHVCLNRASVSLQMSDVEAGGSTVFLDAETKVEARKVFKQKQVN